MENFRAGVRATTNKLGAKEIKADGAAGGIGEASRGEVRRQAGLLPRHN